MKKEMSGGQLKIAVSFSLLSVVALATFANRNLLSEAPSTSLNSIASSTEIGGRGIASVNSKMVIADRSINENPGVAEELSRRSLSSKGQAGHEPSTLEKLAFGYLEGKYTVHLQDGKLSSIELSDTASSDGKVLESRARFIESQRDLLPDFDRVVKQTPPVGASETVEVYELLSARKSTSPVARVRFHLDESGHLLSLQVVPLQIASNL